MELNELVELTRAKMGDEAADIVASFADLFPGGQAKMVLIESAIKQILECCHPEGVIVMLNALHQSVKSNIQLSAFSIGIPIDTAGISSMDVRLNVPFIRNDSSEDIKGRMNQSLDSIRFQLKMRGYGDNSVEPISEIRVDKKLDEAESAFYATALHDVRGHVDREIGERAAKEIDKEIFETMKTKSDIGKLSVGAKIIISVYQSDTYQDYTRRMDKLIDGIQLYAKNCNSSAEIISQPEFTRNPFLD